MQNRTLQIALVRLGEKLAVGNRDAFAALPGSSLLRDQARAIKSETLSHLDRYLEQLEQSVQRQGGHLHFADDGADVVATLLKICEQHGVRQIVKSKSMMTEEIHLNRYLEEAGLEVTETDFGEYVIQLSGERPSHIVGPALHKTAEEMAELFNRKLKAGVTSDPHEMAQFARGLLRQKFAEADLGITGGNFLVAETGTTVIISNEGNARLTSSMPRVLVSIVGIEKLIPRLADLPVFLKVLARAATGQKMSIYTSLISGPRQAGELDGPEEYHVIVVDNGRSKILASPMRESLCCIRCGACLNTCPVYRKIGGHAYGGIYAGPIGAVLTPLFNGLESTYHQPHASSLCGACQAACPVKIQIPELLIRNRAAQHEQHVAPRGEEFIYRLWSWTLRRPWLYRWGTYVATRLLPGLAPGGWLKKLPGPLGGWTACRDFPAPAEKSFHEQWAELERGNPPVNRPAADQSPVTSA